MGRKAHGAHDAQEDHFIGIGEIAEILGIHRNHARYLVLRGTFGEVIDISAPGAQRSRLKVRISAVRAWQRERRTA